MRFTGWQVSLLAAVAAALASLAILLTGQHGPLWALLWGLGTGTSVVLAARCTGRLARPRRGYWVETSTSLRRP